MKYPIVFSAPYFNCYIFADKNICTSGILTENSKIYLMERQYEYLSKEKASIRVFDSDGVEYEVVEMSKLKMKFNQIGCIFDALTFRFSYYVNFQYKEVKRHDFESFKSHCVKMLKDELRTLKKNPKMEGSDWYSYRSSIKEVSGATSISDIIKIILGI